MPSRRSAPSLLLLLLIGRAESLLTTSPLTRAALLPAAGSCRRHPSPVLLPRPPPESRMMLIDGDNLMAHRKVTKGRAELAAKLAGIRSANTVIVFDGKRGEEASEEGTNPRIVITRGGDEKTGEDRETADVWISRVLEAVPPRALVEVVTADRNLRALAHANKVKTINPAKFWRRYLPRIKGQKNDYRNAPKSELDG